MKITKDMVVSIDYTLTDNAGAVIDSSTDGGPLNYLHGHSNIIPGLENELEGKSVGDKFQIKVSPDQGYGERREELIQEVPRDQFASPDSIQIGAQVQAEGEHGPIIFTVVEVKSSGIVLDANHPLAGVELNFDVTVVETRAASKEEIDHGHVH